MRAFLIAFIAWLLLSSGACGRAYYVAQRDTLNADGTITHPYPRIQQAANLMVAGDTCFVRQGVYREMVRPAASGTAGRPLVFSRYQNEIVVIHGGDKVIGAWSVYKGSIYKIAWSGTVKDLFVAGQCMLQARHPNMPYDSARGGFVMLMPQDNSVNPPAGVDWSGVMEIRDAGQGWANQIVQPNKYVNELSAILIGPVGLLDSEGEWAFGGNTLYLWAPRGANPGALLVEAKSRDYGFNLQQRNYSTVQGITFFCTSLFLDQATNCIIDSCKVFYPCPLFLNTSGNGFNRENGASASVNGKGVIIGGSNNIVRNCEIAHSWGDGITLYGSGNRIENCHIYDCDWSGTDCAAITTGGSGHIIRHCTLHDNGRSVLVHRKTTGMRIEYNDMFGAGWLMNDLGITYAFNSDGKGSEICYNWVHECYTMGPGSGGVGIYLDNSTSNYIVHHNAIWTMQTGWKVWGIGSGTPSTGNRWYNNTFDNVLSNFAFRDSGFTNCGFANNIVQRTVTNKSPSDVIVENNYEDSLVSPQFVDPDNGDLQLKSTSPCIGKGKAFPPYTDGYSGVAPDQGAYEYGKPAWTAGSSLAFKIWRQPVLAGQLSRRGWRASPTVNGAWSQFALDGRLDTRWETFSAFPASGARSFFVNMQKPQKFNGIVLYSTARPDQTLKNYEVYVSADGYAYGTPVASGIGAGAVLSITFPTQNAQYIKIGNPNAGVGSVWAIEEIFAVYDTSALRADPLVSNRRQREIKRLRVYSAAGSMAADFADGRFAGRQTPLLGPGLYIMSIEHNDGVVSFRKILVKQRMNRQGIFEHR